MRPDLVWLREGVPVAVVDAKYKRETPSGYPEADVYQMLAYCTALRLRRGHLIYALGGAEGAHHVVRHAGIEIVCHALDLALPPAALLAAVSRLADQLTVDQAAAGLRGTPSRDRPGYSSSSIRELPRVFGRT
jgi:5-methylcytosine-specific restriction enzyme subunit McrC